MRDKRFIAEHRGGLLNKKQHRELNQWAQDCSKHILSLIEPDIDQCLIHALDIAEAWGKGKATVCEARKCSVSAHALAREPSNPIMIAIARSVGHAVATAHMADHSLGAALYGLKAVKSAGKSVDEERKWQNSQLSPKIKALVLTAMAEKEKHFKL